MEIIRGYKNPGLFKVVIDDDIYGDIESSYSHIEGKATSIRFDLDWDFYEKQGPKDGEAMAKSIIAEHDGRIFEYKGNTLKIVFDKNSVTSSAFLCNTSFYADIISLSTGEPFTF